MPKIAQVLIDLLCIRLRDINHDIPSKRDKLWHAASDLRIALGGMTSVPYNGGYHRIIEAVQKEVDRVADIQTTNTTK